LISVHFRFINHMIIQLRNKGGILLPLSSDFHDILEIFVYNNLPLLMNPLAAAATFTTTLPVAATGLTAAITPTTTTTAVITPITPTAAAPVTTTTAVTAPVSLAVTTSSPDVQAKIFTPDVLVALQTAVFNNFSDLGLRSDIQQLADIFFAALPAAPAAITPITPNTPTTPTVPTAPTIPPVTTVTTTPPVTATPATRAGAPPASADFGTTPAGKRPASDILATLQACLI
jgi:hypothetical protein